MKFNANPDMVSIRDGEHKVYQQHALIANESIKQAIRQAGISIT